MVSANIYVSDIDEKKKIINKQITRIEKYVKNFNFCKKNFNNEI